MQGHAHRGPRIAPGRDLGEGDRAHSLGIWHRADPGADKNADGVAKPMIGSGLFVIVMVAMMAVMIGEWCWVGPRRRPLRAPGHSGTAAAGRREGG
jgi:hypothetical protein